MHPHEACTLFLPFLFLLNTRSSSKNSSKPHHGRDPQASGHLCSAAEARGLRRATDLYNLPHTAWPSWISRCYEVIVTTRLPLSDPIDHGRKAIPRSGSPIENALLNRALAYFAWLDRKRALLSNEIAGKFQKAAELNRADTYFNIYGRGIQEFGDFHSGGSRKPRSRALPTPRSTYGYVLRERLWQGGPYCTVAWGPDGVTTLALCYLLRTRHPHLLEGTGLSMIELVGKVPANWCSLEFVDSWKSCVLLDHAVTTLPPPATQEEACRPAPFCGSDFLAKLSPEAKRSLDAEIGMLRAS